MYFPPIGQQELGDCTCWSSCYYYSTFTQARDHGLDASTGDPDVICSPRFLFPIIAQGSWGAECTGHAMARLADVGCAPASVHSMTAWYTDWPTEAAWVAALRNRPGELQKIRVDNEDGLEIVKQHIADGGCVVTRADFLSNYGDYGSTASGTGISNRVMFRREGWHYLRHSICICAYDDERPYYDDRDGQLHYGAFLVANSEGPNWGWYNSTGTGTKGFIWIAYNMFLEGEMGWYDYEIPVSPCFDNAPYPEMYFHIDRPDYRPSLYAAAGLNHSTRNHIRFSGGVGPTSAPEFVGPDAIEQTDEGEISINDSRRVVVDLTDGAGLLLPGTAKNVFVSVSLNVSAVGSATITSVDFYLDLDGDGVYTNISGGVGSPVSVWPGMTRYVSATIVVPDAADFDGDFDVDVDDFAILAGCLAGPDLPPSAGCAITDLCGDGDVALEDFALFQQQFTGP
jgi:hypothetical protein